MSTAWVYRLFLCSLLVALTVPRMTGRGMFGDGLLYATVARNMSIGVGSLWAPSFSAINYSEMYEHPPLGFALQAMAFRLFGDHPAVERGYSLVMFALAAVLIIAIWRRMQPPSFDWLPLLFWILPSIVTWGVINNMLENTQTVFTTAAVLLLLVGAASRSRSATAGWSALAGLCVVAAVLTKGPVGFFPLAVPLILLLLPIAAPTGSPALRGGHMLAVGGATLGAVAITALLLAAYEPSRHALAVYMDLQLLPSLRGERETNADPLATIRHLGLGVAARMAIICAAFWLFGRSSRSLNPSGARAASVFFAIALCASVPIAVSPKLMGHYFLPSVPFYALGFAALAAGPASRLIMPHAGWHRRVPMLLGITLLAASLLVPVVHGSIEPRDEALLRQLDTVEPVLPRSTIIGACGASGGDWRLQSYVNRFYRVSLDARDAPRNGWLLQADDACSPPPGCTPAAEADTLVLFRCER